MRLGSRVLDVYLLVVGSWISAEKILLSRSATPVVRNIFSYCSVSGSDLPGVEDTAGATS